MGPNEKAFQQVKGILGKLDRNIDQLRNQRSVRPGTPTSHPQAVHASTTVGTGSTSAPMPTPRPAPSVPGSTAGNTPAVPTPQRPASIYGRAKPLPPTQL